MSTSETKQEKKDVMSFFPLDSPRKSQELVIREIDSAFNSGSDIVILEAPVGSGKSAVAMTFARQAGEKGSHIITPRKSLQDQYFDDFSDDVVLMKGRNAYPCTMDYQKPQYTKIINAISQGRITTSSTATTCAEGPCRESPEVFQLCTATRPCPYTVAMEVAQGSDIVIHNLHSFVFQASFGGKFEKRKILIIDEAHEIEGIMREFVTKNVYVSTHLKQNEIDQILGANKTLTDWQSFFLQDKFVPEESMAEVNRKKTDPNYKSSRDKYMDSVLSVTSSKFIEKGFSVEPVPVTRTQSSEIIGVNFKFIPVFLGEAVRSMLLNYGEKVLLMSGTVYDKNRFCRNLGIDTEKAHFLRVGSSFPKENRPIYCLPRYQVNTSHATWNDNFSDMIDVIRTICGKFHDVKGLIHVPSYQASEQVFNALNDPRFVNHGPHDFQLKLSEFFESKDTRVFISPTCQQGVDFKDDRARFQIITRVPYMSVASPFVSDMMEKDFGWYMYQALITFGQQIGRVNRSPSDFGVTFLLDERFNRFISKTAKQLPSWVKEAIVWK